MPPARFTLVRSIALAFGIVAAIAAPGASQASTAEQVAAQALQDGDGEKAATAFAEALKQNPRDPRLHYGAGVAARLRGRDDEARKLLQRALDLEPRMTSAAALFGGGRRASGCSSRCGTPRASDRRGPA